MHIVGHKGYTQQKRANSASVSLEAMMLSCTIDTKENRYVMVINIHGAFIYMDMEGTVHMLLEGQIIKLIVKSTQEHMTNTYGILTKGRLLCRYNSKRHFTELYKFRSYSGCYNPTPYKRGDSRLLIRTDAWQKKQSSLSNLLLYGINDLQISHVDSSQDHIKKIYRQIWTR